MSELTCANCGHLRGKHLGTESNEATYCRSCNCGHYSEYTERQAEKQRIAGLEKALAEAQQARERAENERDALLVKAVATAKQLQGERDTLRGLLREAQPFVKVLSTYDLKAINLRERITAALKDGE